MDLLGYWVKRPILHFPTSYWVYRSGPLPSKLIKLCNVCRISY